MKRSMISIAILSSLNASFPAFASTPSLRCGRQAVAAARAIEKINNPGGRNVVDEVVLVSAHSDKELIRVVLKDCSGYPDGDSAYEVMTETLGGQDCLVREVVESY